MDCNVICPMQVRMNDVRLDDNPKFLTEDPTDESHAISHEDNMGTLVNITLSLKGGSQPSMSLRDFQGLK